MRKKPGPVILLLMGMSMTAIGYFMAFHIGLGVIRNGRASVDWPDTKAEIVSSEVIRERRTGAGSSDKKKTMFSPEVVYRYTVDGQTYESTNISFGGMSGSTNSAFAYNVIKQYPKGKTVPAYYNPEEPETATLQTGTRLMSYLPFAFGLVFFVFGAVLLIKPILGIVLILRG